ncbi:MAG: neurotransmitter:Na+ symporter, family [Pseudomonadota bacterium]|nr:neurotransmitter:Na+ symporter, family [Pseudomonadota bacterium]
MATESRISIHGQWSNRLAFILAATGSAVGLGNIWKFPYITGMNGGGAFVLVYLLCILCIGIPILMAESMLGRRGRQSPINTMAALAAEEGGAKVWAWLGWMGVLAGFLILSYYSVIAGWALAYVFRAASGLFTGLDAESINNIFGSFVSDPERTLAWHSIFMVMTMVVVARGVQHGLEKSVRYMMPALFIVLIVLVLYAATTGYFSYGLRFMFATDFSRLSWNAVLMAMGHAFFTLSLGMGAIMMYGSYLPAHTSIAKTSLIIAGADTVVALMAGLAIFPIVFANGLEPASGAGLIFKTLPIAFGQMDAGILIGTLFFILLVFAAWTSSMSLIEPAVAWLVENHGMSRISASVWLGVLSWLLGIASILSFNHWEQYKFWGKTFFDLLDYLTANVMLPLGGLLIAIFAGWVVGVKSSYDEMDNGKRGYALWLFLVRYVTPVAVILIFLNVSGLLDWL